MLFKTKIITLIVSSIFIFLLGPKIKERFWPEQPLVPEQPWINPPSATPATPQPAPKPAEVTPAPATPPTPAVPQDGKWVKSTEVEKTSDGKPIQRWTCDHKGATEPITIWGLVTDYNVKGTDPIIAEFESYKGLKTSVYFNPTNGERKLNSANGEKLDDVKYGEIGKTARSVRFLPNTQDGHVSVEVTAHR